MSERPFKVLGIQQIAVGGTDKGRLRRLWVDTLGLTLDGNYTSEMRTSTRTSPSSAAAPTASRWT